METMTVFEAFEYFVGLGKYEGATVMIHGFDPDDLTALTVEGRLSNLKREKHGGDYRDETPEKHYLVGDLSLDGVKFTLFSTDLPTLAPLEVIAS